jgi:hypothetical protein
MSEINYLKKLSYAKWYVRWYRPVTCEKYILMNDMIIDDVDSLYVKRIILNKVDRITLKFPKRGFCHLI